MNNKNTFNTLNVVTTAMLSALAVILASSVHFLTGGDTHVAALISPMHFPVFLAGILCGQWLGLICGAMAPLISFLTSGRPPFPQGLIPMVFELAAYGFLTGLLRKVFLKNSKTNSFASIIALVLAMIGGRLLNALVGAIIIAATSEINFFVSLGTKLLGNFTSTWAGIIIQLVLIPAILFALQKSGILLKYLPDTPIKKSAKVEIDAETTEQLVVACENDTTDKEK